MSELLHPTHQSKFLFGRAGQSVKKQNKTISCSSLSVLHFSLQDCSPSVLYVEQTAAFSVCFLGTNTIDALDCLKCLHSLNSFVASLPAAWGLYLPIICKNKEENKRNDPEMEESLPLPLYWTVFYVVLLLEYRTPSPIFPFLVFSVLYPTPMLTHLICLSFLLHIFFPIPPTKQKKKKCCLYPPSLSLSDCHQYESLEHIHCAEERRELLFFHITPPACIQMHSTAQTPLWCTSVFRAVTVPSPVHLGTWFGGMA